MQERLFTIDQVADLLGTTPREVHQWIARGWLLTKPGPGGGDRVTERALIGFLKGRGIDLMQLMVSTTVRQAGKPDARPEPAPQADEPAAQPEDFSTLDAARPNEPQAERAELPQEPQPADQPARAKVIRAEDGPSGPSLDEDVAAAMARQMLTAKQAPPETHEPEPMPGLDLPEPRPPHPAEPVRTPQPAAHAGDVLNESPAFARPDRILDEQEVAALLDRPPVPLAEDATEPTPASQASPTPSPAAAERLADWTHDPLDARKTLLPPPTPSPAPTEPAESVAPSEVAPIEPAPGPAEQPADDADAAATPEAKDEIASAGRREAVDEDALPAMHEPAEIEDPGPFVGEVEDIEPDDVDVDGIEDSLEHAPADETPEEPEPEASIEEPPAETEPQAETSEPQATTSEPDAETPAERPVMAEPPPAAEAEPAVAEPAASPSPADVSQPAAGYQVPTDVSSPAPGYRLPATAEVEGVGAQLADAILTEAVTRRASHVHLLFAQAGPALSLRIAGQLRNKPNFPKTGAAPAKALLARLIDLAALTGANKSMPLRGEFTYTSAGGNVQMSMSVLPTVEGLRVTITLHADQPGLAELGASADDIERIGRLLERGGSLVLVAGPSRRDRDDLLGALASQLVRSRRDVMVIASGQAGSGGSPWDPPCSSLTVRGACNCVVDPIGGFRFRDAAGHLRGQNADAIVLGELPDPQTAAAALEAALAGATVVAGITASTPAEALGTLAEMQVESWPLAATLRGVITCRAAARLCLACRERTTDAAGRPGFEPVGCNKCSQTGYNGSAALISVLEPNRQLARLIREAANAETIAATAPEAGPDALAPAVERLARQGDIRAADLDRVP